jgi:putative membrane protein
MSAPVPPTGPPSGTTGTDTAPPVAPVVPGAPVIKQTERPHPATPFIRGWLVLVAVILGWGRQMLPDGESDRFELADLRWMLLAVAGIVVIAAAVGFMSWYFTRFIIDDDELRIETGAIFKQSKKIPFERLQSVDIIQPLAARMFGLAELRLEAGAGDSTTKLRYLKRTQASRLRDYLLVRAHGRTASLRDHDQGPGASAFTDSSADDHTLVRVSPRQLIISFLLSSEFLISFMLTVIALIVTASMEVMRYALSGLIPLVIGTVSVIGRRVVAMFNFTLAESSRGLRITRGLTNLTSQSVPVDRIQGVKITQPLLWRQPGWYRVDVDILGYGQSSGENNEGNATSVLLPVATRDELRLALSRVLPGHDLEQIELHRPPRRSRWVRWFDFWTLRYGWDERVLVTEHGWLSHVRDIVPHAKTQSVRIEQGPLQRRLRLADVHIDTPKGPVNAVAQELDVATARELALTQLDRARVARLHTAANADPVLSSFGIGADALLGSGGETEVYGLDHGRVLRVYRATHEGPEPVVAQLQYLYSWWAQTDIGVEIPLILESGNRAGRTFTVDRRFSGLPFSSWLAQAGADDRRAALLTFLEAADRLHRLPSPLPGFARLVGPQAPAQFNTLAELLNNMLAGPVAAGRADLERDLPDVAQRWDQLQVDLATRRVTPALVHGDICPPNGYVSLGPDGPFVSGIGDFSPHTVNGDPMMDVAGAVIFLALEPYADAAADSISLEAAAVQRYGPETAHWIEVYRRFYAFYFSNCADDQPELYAWCLAQLRR